MSRILVVDDDAAGLEIRKLILEHAGHAVSVAASEAEARSAFERERPEIVLVDLRLEREGAGLDLIRDFRASGRPLRIIVVSGWAHDLAGRVEASMVDAVVPKPSRTERLLGAISKLAVLALVCCSLRGADYSFQSGTQGETVAHLRMASPGADWAKAGAEAALADVSVDGNAPFQVMLYGGAESREYSVFLGPLKPGPHRLRVERNGKYSAAGAGLEMLDARFETRSGDDLLRAPILYARANTVGGFSDVPLIVYSERFDEQGDPFLQYTVIFSNEDGGTSTRALMARWGRTTDIEYVYRLDLRTGKAIIQGRNHNDVEYSGSLEGSHPVLMPITDNNMVGPAGADPPPIRYQIAPVAADLRSATRESVMKNAPTVWRVMAAELQREGKLRPFGKVDGENISHPRNYLYVEMKVANRNSGVGVVVRLKGEDTWRSGDLGRADYAISRDGWVQTTVELPPGTEPPAIAEIGLQCVVAPGADRRMPLAGECEVASPVRTFMLDAGYRAKDSGSFLDRAVKIPTGQILVFRLKRD